MVGQWVCRSAVTIGIIILTYISNILSCVCCVYCVQCLHCVHCVHCVHCLHCVFQQPLPFMVGQWVCRSAVTIGIIILKYISNILSCVYCAYCIQCLHCVHYVHCVYCVYQQPLPFMVGQWVCRSAVTIGIIILTYISNILSCVCCVYCVQCLHCVHCVHCVHCLHCVFQQPLPFMVGQWVCRSAVTIGIIILTYISNILSCVCCVYCVQCLHCVHCVHCLHCVYGVYQQPLPFMVGQWVCRSVVTIGIIILTYISNILSCVYCVHCVVLCVHCVEQSQKSLYFQYRDFWPGSWLLWTERNLWTDLSTCLSINPKMAKNMFSNGLL